MSPAIYRNDFRALRGVAIGLILLFVAAIGLTVWGLRSDAIHDAENDTGNIATVLSGQLARSIQSVDIVLSDVRDQALAQGAQSSDENLRTYDFYKSLHKSLERLPQADAIALVDKTGRVVTSTTQWPPTGTDVSDRDYFQYLKYTNDKGIYISSLMKNRVTGVRSIFFTKRLSGPNDEFMGLILIGLRLAYFESIYQSITALRDQSFVLLHPSGTILIRYPDTADRADRKIPAMSQWYAVVAEGGGSYRSPGYFDDEPRFVSVRPLPDYPLVVNVAVRESAALANWYRRAMLIGVGTLLALACSAILLRRLNNQFRRLIESEAELAQRESSLAERTAELKLAHFQIDTALNNMPQGVLMFDADARLMLFNRRYIEMYNLPPDLIVPGRTLRELVEYRQKFTLFFGDIDVYCRGVINEVAKGKTTSRIIELTDGRTIHAVNHPVPGGGWIATHEDITERKQAQERLAQETSENRRLFEASLDLILVTDRAGNFLRVSPISFAILGYASDEMVGHSAADFVHPPDLDNARTEMRLARRGHNMRNFETRYVHKNGKTVTLAWSGVWSEPEQKHFFTGRDVTESKLAEEKLKNLAHYDQLTGLANRVSLQNDLHVATRDAVAIGGATSIAIFDLDGFKDINDTLGHSLGDRLLQKVAWRMIEMEAGNARFYRLGGDEFVMVYPDCGDPLVIGSTVDAVLKRLAERFEINGHQLFIGASAGVAIAPTDGGNVEELMSNADLALYDAKSSGGNAYRLFMPQLRAKAYARRELDTELRRASVNKEFELYYQPQVRADDGAVLGVEALLRWRHPERGVLVPGVFIDALSESPVVLDVGRWILQSACEQGAAWRAAGLPPLRMGVNLFPAQFRGATLLGDVEVALALSGLPANALEIEITENIALGQEEEVLKSLNTLRSKGVKLAFDDFGTGYASLSYLARYPLTRLKIDQSFVRKISDKSTQEDTAIVRSIIVMAHNLGLEVIAEGVETATQAAFLRAEKCEELQGYLYARPLPAAELEAYLRANQPPDSSVSAVARFG
ncbi:MAG: EAL domain-containing protein [Pseudolabrys sp.]